MSELAYRGLSYRGTMKNETGKLVQKLRDKFFSKNSERKDDFNVEKVGTKIL